LRARHPGRGQLAHADLVGQRDLQHFLRVTGRTAQNKLIHFPSPAPTRTGSYALVEVTAAAAHHLQGELREVVHVAAHKTRIPVAAI
jgi:hypothetical protein